MPPLASCVTLPVTVNEVPLALEVNVPVTFPFSGGTFYELTGILLEMVKLLIEEAETTLVEVRRRIIQ